MADERDSGDARDADLGEFIDSDSAGADSDSTRTTGSNSTGTTGSDSTGTTGSDSTAADSATPESADSESETSAGSGTSTDADSGSSSESNPVEVGVELLSKLEHAELSVAEAVDRIETVTTHPATTRKILDEAEKRGIVEREEGIIKPTGGGGYVSFQSEVVTKEGDFSCRRCGASISEGYFIKLDAGEHGAFGPECIRKVTGRD